MGILKNKKIIAGITGGIAVYKAAGVVSKLRQAGADVHAMMTAAAKEFVTPLTFEALSHNKTLNDLFVDEPLAHVEYAHSADIIVVMPATYNTIGKVAQGIADDYLTTTISASLSPVLFVPAMEAQMYENPVFEENRQKLEALGYHFLEPESGNLASGRTGVGRFPSEEIILGKIEEILSESALYANKKVLITAGPTRERIDPMRVVTNRSSGKMGYAMAQVLREMGADVTLVSGPSQLKHPPGVEIVEAESAEDMKEAVLSRAADVDMIIMAAAVADWRPANISEKKESKLASETMTLELERTPDILLALGEYLETQSSKPMVVGFAAETGDLLEKAKGKLQRKNLDWIVANDLSQPGAGAEIDTNIASLIGKDGQVFEYPMLSKKELARKILKEIASS